MDQTWKMVEDDIEEIQNLETMLLGIVYKMEEKKISPEISNMLKRSAHKLKAKSLSVEANIRSLRKHSTDREILQNENKELKSKILDWKVLPKTLQDKLRAEKKKHKLTEDSKRTRNKSG